MQAMLKERSNYPGWENWARLVKQRLALIRDSEGRISMDFPSLTPVKEKAAK